jgi:RNA recognition motif-containing protein
MPFFLKVVGAKVVTNARSPGARCYGFVTMATSDEATKCINHLHRTELHGRMISVEKVRHVLWVVTCQPGALPHVTSLCHVLGQERTCWEEAVRQKGV